MNTKLLKYVITVAEEKSFSVAAKRLFLSQPSLSQSISNLEKEIGTPIFNRSTVPLSTTYAGDIYIQMAQRILSIEHQSLMEIGDTIDNKAGRIIIGISLFRNSTIMPPIYNAFTAKFPKVQLILVEATNDTLLDMAMSSKLDVAFLTDTVVGNLNHVKLFSDRIVFAISQKNHLFDKYRLTPNFSRINLNELKKEPFAIVSAGSNIRRICELIFHDYGFIPHIAVETQNIDVCYRLSIQTNIVAPIYQSIINFHQHTNSNIKLLLPDFKDYVADVNICYSKNTNLPKLVTLFIETVLTVVEQEGWNKKICI